MTFRRTALLVPVLLVGGILAGCATVATTSDGTSTSAAGAVAAVSYDVDASQSASDVLAANLAIEPSAAASDVDETGGVAIAFDGDSISAGEGVTVDGSVATITAAGTYLISGTLDDGELVVDTTDDASVVLVLDGVDITSSASAAISVTDAKDVVVDLASGSSNTLSDASGYAVDADANAALYSSADLTITGTGELTVNGNGNDGIASGDGLVIESGTITVTAVDDGIRGKDYLAVTGGTITVDAGGDGLKSDNADDETAGFIDIEDGDLTVTAEDDGLAAQTDVVVTGGTLDVLAGGGAAAAAEESSAKGISGAVIVVVEGGDVTIDSADDAIHSSGGVHIASGSVTAASGDDGVHADTALLIEGGKVEVTESNEGLESADIAIAGGDVSITSSDDGLNAAGGSTATTATADETAGSDAQSDTPAAGGPGDSGGPGGGGGMGGGSEVGDYSLTISGGTLTVTAEGDGLDSNGTASITGGTIVVNGPTGSGNGALDVNGEFDISGGTLLAAGSAGMIVSPSASSAQAWISAVLSSQVSAGSAVRVLSSDGTEIASFTAEKTLQSVVFSSSDIVAGASYSVSVDGGADSTVIANEAAASTGMGGGGGR
jgi:hypothetical protein